MRRFGKFSLSYDVVEYIQRNMKDFYVKEFLSYFIILKADVNYCNQTIEYMAYSELFRELSEGELTPEYIMVFKDVECDDGSISCMFEACLVSDVV